MIRHYTSIASVTVYGKKKIEKVLKVVDKKANYVEKVDGKVTKNLKDPKKIKEYLFKDKSSNKTRK